MMELMELEESQELQVQAATVFQPRTPITTRELFAGRWDKLTTLADAVGQPGLHVVIYGERGVGKTSLANIVRPLIHAFDNSPDGSERLVVKANAHAGDTFASIWKKLLSEVMVDGTRAVIGLFPSKNREPLLGTLSVDPDSLCVDDVRRILTQLPGCLFVIDEFDRAAAATAENFTDLLKVLSDFAVNCTVILVGVSDTVDTLIADHASISRTIIQINLPRMETKELRDILSKAETTLAIAFSNEAADLIVNVSQGLPHYTHLLGLHSVRAAARNRLSRNVERSDVFVALKAAVNQAQQMVTEMHTKATHSAHKDALYRQVLLACGVTAARAHDPLGYFNPGSVVGPLSKILSRDVQIATFSNHLSEFCQVRRGNVLDRTGQERGYRFRFKDPLLVPFVFMDALANDLVSDEDLAEMLGGHF